MSKILFLDTVGLLALWNRRDQWHTAAKHALSQIDLRHTRLITTPVVLLECGNAAARTPFRVLVTDLRSQLLEAGDLIEPSPDELEAARAAYTRGEAGEAAIVDHVSFAVMKRLGINTAFSNDPHFRAAGFETMF